MKRIFYTLIALFIVSFSANANTFDVENDFSSHDLLSSLCDPSDLSLGPISVIQGSPPECEDYTFSVPPISGCEGTNLNGFYTFVVTDAIGTTIAFVNYTQSTSISAILPAYGQYFVHVQYSYVDANGVGQSVTVDTNFDYQGCNTTPCHPSSLSLGPITLTEGVMFHCEDYTISVPPISGCPWTTLNGYYSFQIHDFANNLIGENLNTQSTSFAINLPYQAQFFVTVQYHYTDINGQSHTVTETTSFFYAGCDIKPPTVLECTPPNAPGDPQILSWNAVSSAAMYDIQISIDDPDCCPSTVPSLTYTNTQTNNQHTFDLSNACFSWRVRSIATGGAKSEWSEKQCSCGIGPRPKSMSQADEVELSLSAVPNPAMNYVDITMSGESFEVPLTQPEMLIYDMSGKVVYTSEITLYETMRVDVSSFQSGLYIVNVVDDGTVVSTEKLIVE